MPDTMKLKRFRFSLILVSLCCLLLSPLVQAKEWWKVQLPNATIAAEVVRSAADQQLGLGKRFFLPQQQGMLFYYDKPGVRVFWMKNMHFPIDIIWLQNGRILHIEREVPPPRKGAANNQLKRYGFGIVADMVLEIPAGQAKRHGMAQGQILQITRGN